MTDRPPERIVRRGTPRQDDRVLPEVPPDETDQSWGDDPAERSAEWYRRERPPHHGD